jgi:hypothetical protein
MTPEYPVVAQTALLVPAINSPNFDLQNPAASPTPSWAILQSGLAYFYGLTIEGGGTFTGPDYIINPAGAFFYNGTPAAGNLISSIAGSAGNDQFGNAYLQGTVTYSPITSLAVQSFNNQIILWAALSQAGPYAIVSGSTITFNQAPGEIELGIVASTGGTVSAPSLITTDTWHSPALLNGWANTAGFGGFRYQLTPWNSGRIIGAISATAASAITFFTIPSAYLAINGLGTIVADGAPVGCTGGAPAGAVPQVRWDTAGNLTINSAAAVPVAQSYFINTDIPLT